MTTERFDSQPLTSIRQDGLQNLTTGLGVSGHDPTLGYQITPFYPLLQQAQSRWVRQFKLCQKVVQTIPDTMTESWGQFTLGGKTGDDKLVQWITQKLNDIKGHNIFIELNGMAAGFNTAMCRANQSGNAAIALLINDGGTLKDPVDPKRIKSVDGFIVLDRWEIQPELRDFYSIGKVTHYRMIGHTNIVDKYGNRLIANTDLVHSDRVLWFRGQEILDKWELLSNSGCDDSALDSFVAAFTDYYASIRGMARMAVDYDARIHKIYGLMSGLEAGGRQAEENYARRVRQFHQQFSLYRVGVIDKELEEIDAITRNVAGYDTLAGKLLDWCLSNTDLFAYELLGQQVNRSGLADTGKAEQENANRRTSRFQSKKFDTNIRKLIRYLLLSKESPVQSEPESWGWQWNPLYPVSPPEQAELELQRSQIVSTLATIDPTGTFAPAALLSYYGGEKYNPNITLPKEVIKALEDAIKNPQPAGGMPGEEPPVEGEEAPPEEEGLGEDQQASLDELIGQVEAGEVEPQDAVNQAAEALGADPAEVADYLGVNLDSERMDWKKYEPKNKPGDTRIKNGKKQFFTKNSRWKNAEDLKPGDAGKVKPPAVGQKKAIADLNPDGKSALDRLKAATERLKASSEKTKAVTEKVKAERLKDEAKKQPEKPKEVAKKLPPEAAQKAKEVVERTKPKDPDPKPEKPKGGPVKHTDLISKGDSLIPKDIKQKLDAIAGNENVFDERQKSIQKIESLKKEFADAKAGKSKRSLTEIAAEGKAGLEKGRALDAKVKEAEKLMEGLRNQLIETSPVGEKQAQQMASKIKIDENAAKVIPEKELRSQAAEFYRLTGGRGSTTIDDFTKDTDRAYASADKRVVNIGNSRNKAIVFHEMAHHIEFENKGIGKASVDWVLSRATGKVDRLKNITGNQNYRDSEYAVPDKFVSPYVGKIYPTKNSQGKVVPREDSEVISMGVERMTDAKSMARFYLSDPEHFKFVLGALRT